jgi:RimJ/RimL family protein N-acetyltransferase
MMSSVKVFLETERLLLRRFTEADLDDLVALDSDPEVMRFLTGGAPTPREKIRDEVLPRILRDYRRSPRQGRWAAEEKSSGEFLGWFGLRQRPETKRGEMALGYRLRKSAWGKGYATEGLIALIDLCFTKLDIQRVFAETMAVNVASRRVMEKAGMRLARTFHPTWDDPIDGSELGEVEYELLKADWERRLQAERGREP